MNPLPPSASDYLITSGIALLMTYSVSRKTVMVLVKMNELETGLRILARVIARAYLEELAQERKQCSSRTTKEDINVEEANGREKVLPQSMSKASNKSRAPGGYRGEQRPNRRTKEVL
jgi:hypothetical protein